MTKPISLYSGRFPETLFTLECLAIERASKTPARQLLVNNASAYAGQARCAEERGDNDAAQIAWACHILACNYYHREAQRRPGYQPADCS